MRQSFKETTEKLRANTKHYVFKQKINNMKKQKEVTQKCQLDGGFVKPQSTKDTQSRESGKYKDEKFRERIIERKRGKTGLFITI